MPATFDWMKAKFQESPLVRRMSIKGLTLMFMCSCITSIIINDDQQDATILDLFISSLLYMFRAIPSPIIRIT
jgi:hypothetical protein